MSCNTGKCLRMTRESQVKIMSEHVASQTMNLVLLTEHYPYGDQEAFLETEIRVLSRRFREIHIYTFASNKEKLTRIVPANVKVIKVRFNANCFCDFYILLSRRGMEDIKFVTKEYRYTLTHTLSSLTKLYAVAQRCILPHLLKEEIANTVFYSYWFSHLAYALACFKEKNPQAFCVTRAHRYDNFVEYDSCFMRKYILDNIDAVLPISLEGEMEIHNRMLSYFPNNRIKVHLHHLGVEISEAVNPVSDGVIRIVSCSNILPIKRLDMIIDALAAIEEFDIEWVHFGGGRDDAMIHKYAERVLNLKKNITFHFKGSTPHEEVIKYYRTNHVDVFVNASDHEGIPVSVMEAMAAGIICIARSVGGNSELVIDNETGILLPKEAEAAHLCKAIKHVLELDVKTRNYLKANAMKKVYDDFDVNKVYDSFVDDLLKMFDQHMHLVNAKSRKK